MRRGSCLELRHSVNVFIFLRGLDMTRRVIWTSPATPALADWRYPVIVRALFAAVVFVVAGLSSTPPARTDEPCPNVVWEWNNVALAEVRMSKSLRNGPPMVARALAIVHTCVYDAWAAYDDVAVGTTDTGGTRRRPPDERTDENKAKAISFAAYRCLRNLYPDGSLPPQIGRA